MTLFETLLNTFGTNEPIMTNEIVYGDYSRPWLYKELNKLCEEGKLIRFERGVYYIPTETPFGVSVLDPSKVITKKYINNGKEQIGYYSGITFLNKLRLSTQMSNTVEIYTNNEPSNVREVFVGRQKILLRKSRTTVDNSNAVVLSFLEMMNLVPTGFFDAEKMPIIKKYIAENKITKDKITKYAPYFPDKTMRTLVESQVIYNVAQ